MGKERKYTKKGHQAYLKRSAEAMREVKKTKKIHKTPQDPVVGSPDIQNFTMENDNLECKIIKEEIEIVFEPEETFESGDDTKKRNTVSGSDVPCKTQSNEELWLVRKQLCRGCHSEGAFWSLHTSTEGDTYGDLLQTYFNIQLCPVSQDELALSAICTLCAARLRDARAFSAQARAAEERFTRFYKQNRVRALVNEVEVKEDVPKIKIEVDDSEITEPDTANSNLDNPKSSKNELIPTLNKNKKTQERRDKPTSKRFNPVTLINEVEVKEDVPKIKIEVVDSEITVNVEPDTANSNLDNPESPINELAPTPNKNKKTQEGRDKPTPKTPAFRLLPSDYERVGNLFKCTRCDKMYKKGMINQHVKYTHIKLPRNKFNCTHCDKTFHLLSQFTRHKFEEHSIDDRIKCNACDWFTFQKKTFLTRHKNNFHMLGEKLTCPDCDYICFSERSMKRHAVTHSTVKEHHCKFCNKSFLRKRNLEFHERIHTGDKRKVCNVCGQAFVQRASLTYHMTKHHPEVRF